MRTLSLLFLLLDSFAYSSISAAEPKVVGYFVEWGVYDRQYYVKDVPADKLTHLNYAFAKIVDGECAIFDSYAALEKPATNNPDLKGNYKQLQELKKKCPHLKTLISVGGWTLSSPFSDVAASEKTRAKFCRSCVAFIQVHGFDGIDIDWEYPVAGGLESNKKRPEDKANFTLVLRDLREQLDKAGKQDEKSYLLTIAAPAGQTNIANIEADKIHPYLDWLNVMTYDFHGSWDPTTHFNAPLFAIKDDPATDEMSRKLNVAAALQTYLDAGVPAAKLVMGIPFYGRGWAGVKNVDDGLFQAKTSIPKGTWEEGIFDYKDLKTKHRDNFKRHWHAEAKVPWLYSKDRETFISYDDPESIKHKAAFVREKKLGGMMCWELSADDPDAPLLEIISRELKK